LKQRESERDVLVELLEKDHQYNPIDFKIAMDIEKK
jgi:hypothetical protein